MGDIGEAYARGRWVLGNEYNIWAAIQGKPRGAGIAGLAGEKLERCRQLSRQINGWIVWLDSDFDPDVSPSDEGPCFVQKEQWLEMVANFERGSLPKIALTNTQNKEQSK